MSDYIKQLISEGEHQRLEFKFEVSDFRKIARTLVAFANTDGGHLLIGVKDNGAIAGVRSAEEFFMIDGAAKLYCRPEIPFKTREWQADGKKVLEIIITSGINKPYFAQEPDGSWTAYIRQMDENFKAGRIILKVWERQKSGKPLTIKFRSAEKTLLDFLESNPAITISRYRRLAGLTASEAEEILVLFILSGILKMTYTAQSVTFSLVQGYQDILERYTLKP
jgi:predicted HTH transcriptional regulator